MDLDSTFNRLSDFQVSPTLKSFMEFFLYSILEEFSLNLKLPMMLFIFAAVDLNSSFVEYRIFQFSPYLEIVHDANFLAVDFNTSRMEYPIFNFLLPWNRPWCRAFWQWIWTLPLWSIGFLGLSYLTFDLTWLQLLTLQVCRPLVLQNMDRISPKLILKEKIYSEDHVSSEVKKKNQDHICFMIHSIYSNIWIMSPEIHKWYRIVKKKGGGGC